MLRRPRLLVLDEATSAIDVESEQAFLDHLFEATPRPTIVMITHRHEILSRCERVIYFEDGKVIPDAGGYKGASSDVGRRKELVR
jgi:ABC-type bacteriocin/lantibiotic exporter with double-glycine peptidase domain